MTYPSISYRIADELKELTGQESALPFRAITSAAALPARPTVC